MIEAKAKRLSKIAKELNVGISTIVDFLNKKGIEVDSNPNAKILPDAYKILLKEYQPEISLKEESEKIELEKIINNDFGFGEQNITDYLNLLKQRKQIIIQGPPGTGKSYLAEILANRLTNNKKEFCKLIQFHPSYSYEDFMEGYKPSENNSFKLTPGIFKKTCELAESEPSQNIVLIIDEINRGDTSKIFGELFYLLEYRSKSMILGNTSESFQIPQNLLLIGTMNTADRSLAIVDIALRRRFAFITVSPLYDIIRNKYNNSENSSTSVEAIVTNLRKINELISSYSGLGSDFQIGHSFFLKSEKLDSDVLEWIWKYDLHPLLKEYFFEEPSEIENIKTELFNF
jgi:5-methylcytosine-specific restriction protein B